MEQLSRKIYDYLVTSGFSAEWAAYINIVDDSVGVSRRGDEPQRPHTDDVDGRLTGSVCWVLYRKVY